MSEALRIRQTDVENAVTGRASGSVAPCGNFGPPQGTLALRRQGMSSAYSICSLAVDSA